jgi:hypothetical protein
MQTLVRRHEILRTGFVAREPGPVAIVRATSRLELPLIDLRDDPDAVGQIEELIALERGRPYDLEQGPLFRLRLVRLGDDEHLLLRFTHHLLHDADSWKILFQELGVVYEALIDDRPSPLSGSPPLQYIDFAAWERACVRPRSRRFRHEIEWWERELEAAPDPLQLPFARAERDETAPREQDVIRWGISAESAQALDRVGREAGSSYFMTRLASFAALLAIETGAEDLVLGTPVSTRTRPELQRMFGPFVNFTLLRLRLGAVASFAAVLAEVRRAVLEVGAHVSLPWEELRDGLRGRGVEIPQQTARFVSFSSLGLTRFGGLEVEPLPRLCGGSIGFRLGVNRQYEQARCWTEFDPRIYDPAAIASFLSRLGALTAAVAYEPQRALREHHRTIALV